MGYDTNSGNAPLPLRKEVLRAARRKLAEAGGAASLRLVGGALISIDSGGGLAENETGNGFFPPFFCLVFRFALSPRVEFVWRREAMGRDSDLGSGRMVSIATGDGGIVEAQYIDKLWVDLIRPNYARFLGRTDIAKTFFPLELNQPMDFAIC